MGSLRLGTEWDAAMAVRDLAIDCMYLKKEPMTQTLGGSVEVTENGGAVLRGKDDIQEKRMQSEGRKLEIHLFREWEVDEGWLGR